MPVNVRKRHIRYKRALTEVLLKHGICKENLSAIRNDIANVVIDEVVGVSTPIEYSDFEDCLDSALVDCYRQIQSGVLTGQFDEAVITKNIQSRIFMRLIDDMEERKK